MLKRVVGSKKRAENSQFAIVASKYNARYVDAMLKEARKVIKDSGGSVKVIRVPGAFEIPVVTSKIAAQSNGQFAGIICLGVILRGATTHAQHIGEAVSNTLAQVQVQHQIPVIHEVLLLENEDQARERCLSREHNRGAEAAYTAIEMATVMRQVEELIS